MLKKEEVYVRVSSKKKARKLKDILDMFGFEYCDTQFLYDVFYFNDERDFCSCHNKDYPVSMGKTKVSLKELRNILTREYLKEGDYVVLTNGLSGKIKNIKNNDEFIIIDSEKDKVLCIIQDFKRYATKEEKQLLKTQESVIDKAISLLQHGLWLDYSHEVIQGLEKLKNK